MTSADFNTAWYYTENGSTYGPFTLEHIGKLLASSQLRSTTKIWGTADPVWREASTIPHLVSYIPQKSTYLGDILPASMPPLPTGNAWKPSGTDLPVSEDHAEHSSMVAEPDKVPNPPPALSHNPVITIEISKLEIRRNQLRKEVIGLEDQVLLEEVGLYTYSHPLQNSAMFKERLDIYKREGKGLIKRGGAVAGAQTWTVNGSAQQGQKMVKDFSKLMLRAYNAEVDNAVRTVKPHTLPNKIKKIEQVRRTITKLGMSMSIVINEQYHLLRLEELKLAADFQAKKAEEREQEREEKVRLRDEAQAKKEYASKKAALIKEQQHYTTVLAKLRDSGSDIPSDVLAKLEELETSMVDLAEREANTRAGYVYIISNIGSFGKEIIKIGMTRRLEPMDRVRELGDASVPFRFDVHALIFSKDAVTLENQLHKALASQRVNRINLRREYFFATPAQVNALLANLDVHLLEYHEIPEAVEYRQSQAIFNKERTVRKNEAQQESTSKKSM